MPDEEKIFDVSERKWVTGTVTTEKNGTHNGNGTAARIEAERQALRDQFAMHAPFWRLVMPSTDHEELATLARMAYVYADCMVEARRKQE